MNSFLSITLKTIPNDKGTNKGDKTYCPQNLGCFFVLFVLIIINEK